MSRNIHGSPSQKNLLHVPAQAQLVILHEIRNNPRPFKVLQEIESGQLKLLVAQKYRVPIVVYKLGALKHFGSKNYTSKVV